MSTASEPKVPDATPTTVKIEAAKAEIAKGNEGMPSRLSVDIAEKNMYWSKFFDTPQGKAIGALFVGFITLALTWANGLLDGSKKFSDLGGPIPVEIVKMPKIEATFAAAPAGPTPLPVQAKPFGIVTFSATVPPLDQAFWDSYRAKGYRVDNYSSTGSESQLWSSLITKAGGGDCVIVTDTKNFLGGAKLTDKAAAAATIAKYAADK